MFTCRTMVCGMGVSVVVVIVKQIGVDCCTCGSACCCCYCQSGKLLFKSNGLEFLRHMYIHAGN